MVEWAPLFTRFNSRTCEGATDLVFRYKVVNSVSIHAPVKVRRQLRLVVVDDMGFQFTHL